jgi:hypothetical protein
MLSPKIEAKIIEPMECLAVSKIARRLAMALGIEAGWLSSNRREVR